MAGLGRKTIYAARPVVSFSPATSLPLVIIFAVAMATPETSPRSAEQLITGLEQTNGYPSSIAEAPINRGLFDLETKGRAERCTEPRETSANSQRVRRGALSFAEKPKAKATLAFVFDTTGSMSDDMVQARQGAKAILQAFTERDEVPVSNFILAPFNDPQIPPMSVTENPDVFVNALNKLNADGGGDCPEMACSGILNTLQEAYPRSWLYVFTDAPPKDHHLLEKIVEVNQRKRSQVTFILSGLCDPQGKYVSVYDQIAGASGGEVFSVTKHDIKTVLDFVRDTLRGGDETVYSVRRSTPITKEPHSEYFNVTVEIGLEELRISLTGNKPAVIVINPLGVIIGNLKTILTLSNVIVVSVLNPEPAGIWKVEVTIQPKTSSLSTIPNGFALQVRATGVSYKIFQGFSIQPSHSLEETANQPLEGTKNYLLIEIKPLQKIEEKKISLEKHTWEYVVIQKLDGEIYSTQALKPISRKDNETQIPTFLAGPFDIPLGLFTLAFHGFDENGNPISRMPHNAISSAPVSPPFVTMETELVESMGKTLKLHCVVESLIPFTLDWYKNGDLFLGNLSYEQSHDAQLIIPSAKKDDEGLYTCKATNSKGSTETPSGTSVRIIAPPVIVKMKATKTEILENETVMLDCEVESESNHTVEWTLENEGNIVRLSNGHPSERIHLLNNNSLLITSFHHNFSGLYICSAENKAGEVKREMELLLVLPPVIHTTKEDFYFTNGDEIELECKVKGKVGANITWKLNGNPLPHLIKSSTRYAHSIHIPTKSNQWEGKYTCVAENAAGNVQKEIMAMYWEPPIVKPLTKQYMSQSSGELATISCAVSGIPLPKMRWLHSNKPIANNQYYEISKDGLSLSIHGFNAATEGTYICEAQSILNSTSKSDFHLLLGTPPKPSASPNDAVIELGKEEWLHCNAESPVEIENFPQMAAKISWKRENNIPIDLMRHEVLTSGTLHIIDFQKEDEGFYICTIENDYGKIDLKVNLQLEGSTNSANSRHCIFDTSFMITLIFILYLMFFCSSHHASCTPNLHRLNLNNS